MKIYLVSNNLLLDGLSYESGTDLETVRIIRPLSVEGDNIASKISEYKELQNVEKIYSSFYSSALSTAKYLANNLNLKIIMNNKFNDCKVGALGSKNMKMVKGLQDHDFTYRLPNGESLNDVGNRIDIEIKKIVSNNEDVVVFTHKRAILGFLLKYCNVGYNLDDSLILEYNGNQVYDDTDTEFDMYELEFENNELVSIKTF